MHWPFMAYVKFAVTLKDCSHVRYIFALVQNPITAHCARLPNNDSDVTVAARTRPSEIGP